MLVNYSLSLKILNGEGVLLRMYAYVCGGKDLNLKHVMRFLCFESVDKTLACNHSNESVVEQNFPVGAVYYPVQRGSNF